ncbi:PhzF family phenazine biosynthesis protein [Natronoflexus pectinivorans]|uniref:PhzF family phenazine biosynthesis protein n=1 Tax=Natronoflexus pectinivorans TaxID=682526 RepID=A0A4R2GJC5_9BACT|nr:PhzF family phenazine biosynthesis protein [Natronoflexus pectinivorans]TCO08052.1 PhzF family phenazine biosynthesis protein [Natronoflexus pectinivorans]
MVDNSVIYQVDAFTGEVFKGNPAGVMLVDESFASHRMQNIAMEMNLSETAFVIPCENDFEIRYFTPTVEVPLCGHATLSAAHIIYELGMVEKSRPIVFRTKRGNVSVTMSNGWIVMDFPEYRLSKIETPNVFPELLGFEPLEMYRSEEEWLIAVANDAESIRTAAPNFEALVKHGLGELMITAESDDSEADFVVRCFAPKSGINEDPVTGSAHCALTPLWSQKLGKSEMISHQVSRRSGVLKVALKNSRVEIMGEAVTVFKAELKF